MKTFDFITMLNRFLEVIFELKSRKYSSFGQNWLIGTAFLNIEKLEKVPFIIRMYQDFDCVQLVQKIKSNRLRPLHALTLLFTLSTLF